MCGLVGFAECDAVRAPEVVGGSDGSLCIEATSSFGTFLLGASAESGRRADGVRTCLVCGKTAASHALAARVAAKACEAAATEAVVVNDDASKAREGPAKEADFEDEDALGAIP